MPTPWGPCQHAHDIAPGITSISTASHGGIYLSPQRLAEMPDALRSIPVFSGERGWYEEDCDAAIVVLAFPQFFLPAAVASAIDMAKESLAIGGSFTGYLHPLHTWINSDDPHAVAARRHAACRAPAMVTLSLTRDEARALGECLSATTDHLGIVDCQGEAKAEAHLAALESIAAKLREAMQ